MVRVKQKESPEKVRALLALRRCIVAQAAAELVVPDAALGAYWYSMGFFFTWIQLLRTSRVPTCAPNYNLHGLQGL